MIINSMNNNLSFDARFRKKPVEIHAVIQNEEFTVSNPWGANGTLTGYPGYYKVTNHRNEVYPLAPESYNDKYEPIPDRPNWYRTKTDRPSYTKATFPRGNTVTSCEGEEHTEIKGMKAVEAIDATGKPYPIPYDEFVAGYEPADQEAEKMMEEINEYLENNKLKSI